MTVRVLHAADRTPVPWKNGGGLTREIALHPPGSGMEDFEWRVSTAEVAADGPFSRFDGIDRTLVILDGAGFVLAIEGSGPLRLTPASDPHAFPADVPTAATLLAGPVTDLNVMARRGVWSSQVDRLEVAEATKLTCDAAVCLILALDPLSLGGIVALEPGDVLRLDAGDVVTLHPLGGTSCVIVIELSRA